MLPGKLKLTSADERFIRNIVFSLKQKQSHSFEQDNHFVCVQMTSYFLSLFACDVMQSSNSTIDQVDKLSYFNSQWVESWQCTSNYETWRKRVSYEKASGFDSM